MSSPSSWRHAKKRKSPTDAALTTEQPLTSIHHTSTKTSAEHHSSKLLEQNNQRNNGNDADFLSFLTKMSNSVRDLTDHFVCPVCLDLLSDAHVAPECLHHFCGNCIKESLHRCKNECPSCRARISTRRSLRHDKSYDLIVTEVRKLSILIEEKLKELEARAVNDELPQNTHISKDPPNEEKAVSQNIHNVNGSNIESSASVAKGKMRLSNRDDGDESSDSSVCFLETRHAPIIQHQRKRLRPLKPPPTIMELIDLDSMSSDADSDPEESSDDEEWTCREKKSHSKYAMRCKARSQRKSKHQQKKDDDGDDHTSDDDPSDSSSYLSPSTRKRQKSPAKIRSFEESSVDKANQKANEQNVFGQPTVKLGSAAAAAAAVDDSNGNKRSLSDCEKGNETNISSTSAKDCLKSVPFNIYCDSSDDSDSSLFDEILNISAFKTDSDETVDKVATRDEGDKCFKNYKREGEEEEEEERKEIVRFSPPETSSGVKLDDIGTWSDAVAVAKNNDCCKMEPEKVAYSNLIGKDLQGMNSNRYSQERSTRQRQVTQRYGNMLSDCQLDAYLSVYKR